MGCVQSTRVDATHSPRAGHTSTCNSVLHKSVPDTDDAGRKVRSTRQLVLPPEQVLGLCSTTCSQFFPGQAHITLAAIALVESSGDAEKLAERASIADITCGLCQVPLTTARWLARDQGCNAFPVPTQQLLLDPVPNLYYCGSHLQLLSNHQGWPRTEEFVVKAYHAGPKDVDSFSAHHYWEKVRRAQQLLQRLQDALDAADAQGGEGAAGPVMHVMQPGDTLAHVAAVCSVSVDDIMRSNSDLECASDVQTYDCIALPVSRILPRVYAVQPGDTLYSIAVAHRTTATQILELNPEVRQLGKLHSGWVVALPGLLDSAAAAGDAGRSRRWQLATTHHTPAPAHPDSPRLRRLSRLSAPYPVPPVPVF